MPRPTPGSSRRRVASCASLLAAVVLFGCARSERASSAPGWQGTIEVAVVLPTGSRVDSVAVTAFYDPQLTFRLERPVVEFHGVRFFEARDALGYPAVGVELGEQDRQRFLALTTGWVGRQLGILVDGRLVVNAGISEPMAGSFILPTSRFSDADRSELWRLTGLGALEPR